MTEPGQGARHRGRLGIQRTASCPVNVSGGLKAKAHPVYAAGMSQHVIAAIQLTGTAGAMQLATARAPLRRTSAA